MVINLLMKTSAFLRFLPALVVLASMGAPYVRADIQTLTDTLGRTIKADVLSVENEKVKIKREDGQIFELPLSTLSEKSQRLLSDWAAKSATQIPAGALTIELSRGAFSSTKQDDVATITTEENWGYSVTVSNRSFKAIENLRFEYVLFVKPDVEPGKDSKPAPLKRSTGKSTVPLIGPSSKTVFRTETIKIYKQKLKPGWIWGKTGGSEKLRDTLYGIWLKAYSGDQLVAEMYSPDSLVKTEKGP
jgi:hypothetical protein